jgi:surfeit locus 1 family protein
MSAASAMSPTRLRAGLAAFASLGALTTALGCWQMERRTWKIAALEDRAKHFAAEPEPLEQYVQKSTRSASIAASAGARADRAELQRIQLPADGVFLHDKTVLVGPRPAPKTDAPSGGLAAMMPSSASGYYAVTPLQSADGSVMLVNRGWVPKPKTGEAAATIDATESPAGGVAVVRAAEQMPLYVSASYDAPSNTFISMDLPLMLQKAGLLSAKTAASPAAEVYLEMLGTDVSARDAARSSVVYAPGRRLNFLFGHVLFPSHHSRPAEPQSPLFRRKHSSVYFSGGLMSVSPDKHALYAATWFSFTGIIGIGSFVQYRKYAHLLRK